MANFVYSTMTNGTDYVEWYSPGKHQLPTIKRRVSIKGGAGMMTKRVLQTPLGVSTEVTDADMEFLEANQAFNEHVKKGWLHVVKSRHAPAADVVAADMPQRDDSAPLVPNDFADGKVPTSGTVKPSVTTRPRNSKLPTVQTDFR